ncbi:MAG: 5'/3'-nucleotidase SurE [Candidatus Heimdallarchaeota archaeon]|nr:5'/3'-nucleotidase SurE [Candidatus Heimdallarchaeota archaeon]
MTEKKYKILLTCDDGLRSNGLIMLYKALKKIAQVTIITPHIQRSAEGKGITINQILHVEKEVISENIQGYTIDGSSADAVIFGLQALSERPFDMVVAGINQGLNISSHIILTSGTCAAAFEAAYMNIPAIAFSMDVHQANFFVTPPKETFKVATELAAKMVEKLLGKRFPPELAFFNVNFPKQITRETLIEITSLADRSLTFKPIKHKDPRENDYYFLWGDAILEAPPGTDLHAILKNKISISPVTKNLSFLRENKLFKHLLLSVADDLNEI